MRICFVLLVVFAASILPQAQTQNPSRAPQTARQALIEMFMGKSPDAFAKHLPQIAGQVLIHKGDSPETSLVQRISMIGKQLTAQGHIQTFDEGPTILELELHEGQQQVREEVIVEHDSLMGENDEIELSFHVYRDGQPEFLPVIPRLILSMTQENEIWRLYEATIAAHVPLTDPDYLKGARQKQNEANENMASMRVGILSSAELSYASKHPDQGYSCSLGDLTSNADADGSPGRPPGESAGGTPGDEVSGYYFSLAGCAGTPALKFQITAVPVEPDSGMKAFCTDETRKVRFDATGRGATCLSRGRVLNEREISIPGSAD